MPQCVTVQWLYTVLLVWTLVLINLSVEMHWLPIASVGFTSIFSQSVIWTTTVVHD